MKVEGTEISDLASLRMSATSTRKQAFPHEVKWGTGLMRDIIAAAIPNGIICIYKDGKIERQLTEHQRQIHRLAFCPTQGSYMLSGSADGTVRLWDLRDKKSSKLTFNANSDIVRDVQFNPTNVMEFAAAFDNGTVQVVFLLSIHDHSAVLTAIRDGIYEEPISVRERSMHIVDRFCPLTGTRMEKA